MALPNTPKRKRTKSLMDAADRLLEQRRTQRKPEQNVNSHGFVVSTGGVGGGGAGAGGDQSGVSPGDVVNTAMTFTDLTDTPSAYTGDGLKLVRVNAGESGLEFATDGGGTVTGSGTDNRIMRWDGTANAQDSGWSIADNNQMLVNTALSGDALMYIYNTGTATSTGGIAVYHNAATGAGYGIFAESISSDNAAYGVRAERIQLNLGSVGQGGWMDFGNLAGTPANAETGELRVYNNAGTLYALDSAGTSTSLMAGGGGGTPGGASGDVQFNDGASGFAGDAGMNYNTTSDYLTLTSTSMAGLRIANSGTTNDPLLVFSTAGTDRWNLGCDNSASDNLMISTGTTPSATPVMSWNLGAGHVGIGTAAGQNTLHVYENGADTGNAGVMIEQDGTGDAMLEFSLTGLQQICIGLDNSDSDKFVISDSTTLGTTNRMTLDTSGNVVFTGAMNVVGGYSHNGTAGIDTTVVFIDADANTHGVVINGGLITAWDVTPP